VRLPALISESARRPCRYEEMTPEVFRAEMMTPANDPYQLSAIDYYEGVRAGRIAECADTFDVLSVLGRKPRTWEEFARAHLSIF
jgi:hypothetical protein